MRETWFFFHFCCISSVFWNHLIAVLYQCCDADSWSWLAWGQTLCICILIISIYRIYLCSCSCLYLFLNNAIQDMLIWIFWDCFFTKYVLASQRKKRPQQLPLHFKHCGKNIIKIKWKISMLPELKCLLISWTLFPVAQVTCYGFSNYWIQSLTNKLIFYIYFKCIIAKKEISAISQLPEQGKWGLYFFGHVDSF